MLNSLKHSAKRAAQIGMLKIAATLAFIVSIGFVTSAIWMALASTYDALTASLILSGIFFGAGLVLLLVAMSLGPNSHVGHSSDGSNGDTRSGETESNLSPLVQAFMFGLNAGFKSGKR